jgi:signal transduction histidine kinase
VGVYEVAYSLMSWVCGMLAQYAGVIATMLFCRLDESNPKAFKRIRFSFVLIIIVLSCIYTPWTFAVYKHYDMVFWFLFCIQGFATFIMGCCFLRLGIKRTPPGKARTQKRLFVMLTMPPLGYEVIAVYVIRPFNIERLNDTWLYGIFVVIFCLVIYGIFAFRTGIIGLRLSREHFDWDNDLDIAEKSAAYMAHMLKNQIIKIEWSAQNLIEQADDTPPEELNIITNSVETLKQYIEAMKKHSGRITVNATVCLVGDLVKKNAEPLTTIKHISVEIHIPENLSILCDIGHMSEMFANLLQNAAEAVSGTEHGRIVVNGKWDALKKWYLLSFADNGKGMSKTTLDNMFRPYYSTKQTPENMGLGLTYCKNVAEAHGGTISAQSREGKGSALTIRMPASRVGQ